VTLAFLNLENLKKKNNIKLNAVIHDYVPCFHFINNWKKCGGKMFMINLFMMKWGQKIETLAVLLSFTTVERDFSIHLMRRRHYDSAALGQMMKPSAPLMDLGQWRCLEW
jgi:hypothetical protein